MYNTVLMFWFIHPYQEMRYHQVLIHSIRCRCVAYTRSSDLLISSLLVPHIPFGCLSVGGLPATPWVVSKIPSLCFSDLVLCTGLLWDRSQTLLVKTWQLPKPMFFSGATSDEINSPSPIAHEPSSSHRLPSWLLGHMLAGQSYALVTVHVRRMNKLGR